MLTNINATIKAFNEGESIQLYPKLLDAADQFVVQYRNGVTSDMALDVGIELFKALTSLSYIGQLREFEHDYKLHNRILLARVRVFKACIPPQLDKLRGLPEMLVGMKENELSN